jgi:hypothetical protein
LTHGFVRRLESQNQTTLEAINHIAKRNCELEIKSFAPPIYNGTQPEYHFKEIKE